MENSAFGRLLSVLFAPGQTFRSIAERPTWVLGFLVVAIAPAVLNVVAFAKIDMVTMLTEQLEKQGQTPPPEQIDTMVAVATWTAPVGAFIVVALLTLFTGLVLWLLFKVVGGEFSFHKSMSVVTHASVATVIGFVLRILVVASKDSVSIDVLKSNQLLLSNLGFLAPADASAFIKGLLGAVDVFSLWTLWLMVRGYEIVGRVSSGKAWAIAGGFWVVITVISVALGSMAG